MSTEIDLKNWRYGSTQSEYLCAALLHSEGYDDVDPQSPQGGPDGRKDILCKKSGLKYVAACYFPYVSKEFTEIKDKLLHDNEGVSSNNAEGLVFFVNQSVSPSQRAELAGLVEPNTLDLYHLERIRSILDSPKGYGMRLEYLRIPMSGEEQMSLLSVINFRVDERLKEQNRELVAIRRSLEDVRVRTIDITGMLTKQSSSLDEEAHIEAKFPTSSITLSQLGWVHRLVTENDGMPLSNRGRLRETEVWIGVPGRGREEAEFIPPPADHIPNLIKELLRGWRMRYPALIGAPKEAIIKALAEFHHGMLLIHPFLDGNGRVARALLQQQSLELLDKWVPAHFTDEPATYYRTLRLADEGNLEPLFRLISANIE